MGLRRRAASGPLAAAAAPPSVVLRGRARVNLSLLLSLVAVLATAALREVTAFATVGGSSLQRVSRRQRKGGEGLIPSMVSASTARSVASKSRVAKKAASTSTRDVSTSHFNGDVTRMLTREEEIMLGRKVQAMIRCETKKEEMEAELGREPTEVEWATALDMRESDLSAVMRIGLAAKHHMVTCNLRLVMSMARKMFPTKLSPVPRTDVIQEGTIGLVRAVEKFDPERGFRFSTYATWWIKQRMYKAQHDSRIVRVPQKLVKTQLVSKAVREELELALGRSVTLEEIASHMGIELKKLEDAILYTASVVSLDKPIQFGNFKGETRSRYMTLACKDEASPDAVAEWSSMREALEVCMGCELSQLQRDIVRMRMGLDDGRSKTAKELSQTLKIPVQAIVQEHNQAIQRLRGASRSRNLADYLSVVYE